MQYEWIIETYASQRCLATLPRCDHRYRRLVVDVRRHSSSTRCPTYRHSFAVRRSGDAGADEGRKTRRPDDGDVAAADGLLSCC